MSRDPEERTKRPEWIKTDFPVMANGIGRDIRHVAVTDSTNRLARAWAGGMWTTEHNTENRAVDGAVVLAEHQTSGRGRLGRSWESSAGQNLLLSVIVRAQGPLLDDFAARGMLPLATALAVSDALSHFVSGANLGIKWPNDVLLDGKKCSGILVEAGPEDTFIIGIGLNVNETSFSDEVAGHATSLLLHTGQRFDRKAVYERLMEELNRWIPRVSSGDFAGIREEYVRRLAGRGAAIELSTGSEVIRGTLIGIHDDGGLIVESNSVRKVYYAGDVSLSHRLF